MVTVNKNNIVNSENITLKKNKVFKENLDGVFAELFSLVNMENIENGDKTKKNLLDSSSKNKESIEFGKNNFSNAENSEENILAAARSLVSVFYKELNLDNPNEGLKENKYINPAKNTAKVQFENQKNSIDPKLVNKVETKELELKIPNSELKKDKNLLVKIYKKILERHILKKPLLLDYIDKILNPIMGKSFSMYFEK